MQLITTPCGSDWCNRHLQEVEMTGSKNEIIGRMLWQRWISKSFARNTFVESLHSLPRRVIQIHWLPPISKTWSNGIIIPRRSINTLEQSHSEVYQTAKPKLKPSSAAFIIANSVALLPSISKLAESTVNSHFQPNEDSRFKFVVQLVYVIFSKSNICKRSSHPESHGRCHFYMQQVVTRHSL